MDLLTRMSGIMCLRDFTLLKIFVRSKGEGMDGYVLVRR